MTGFFAIPPKRLQSDAGAPIGIYVALPVCSQMEIIHFSVNTIFHPSVADFQFKTLDALLSAKFIVAIPQFISRIGEYFERIDLSDS